MEIPITEKSCLSEFVDGRDILLSIFMKKPKDSYKNGQSVFGRYVLPALPSLDQDPVTIRAEIIDKMLKVFTILYDSGYTEVIYDDRQI